MFLPEENPANRGWLNFSFLDHRRKGVAWQSGRKPGKEAAVTGPAEDWAFGHGIRTWDPLGQPS